jgi:hypothetical protein
MLTAIQYAWLYLVENGAAGREPSYYGGYDFMEGIEERFPNLNKYDFREDRVKDAFLLDIARIGVDWSRTKEPTMDFFSQFEGTFNDSSQKEYMKGTLVLKDGSKQEWCAEKLEISNIFQMMAMVSEAESKFIRIFGNPTH